MRLLRTYGPRNDLKGKMCGIAGFVQSPPQINKEESGSVLERMTTQISHRGPDWQGLWVNESGELALGFRRLAIIDLSETGRQPMFSACGRYTIVFNGEIYNYKQLKVEVETSGKFSFGFRGTSDTEVLLAAMTVWGVEAALKKTNGMFAFAVWDREIKKLVMARDRLGEKPLYYGVLGKTLLFGSELKALKQHPSFRGEIDRSVLTLYMRTSYIPAPYSIYRNIFKLPPATFAEFDPTTATVSVPVPYWSAQEAAESGVRNPFRGDERDALTELDSLLKESVKMRMQSDVPLGAFLSGGVDSSTIVALMQAQSSQPVKTFSMGFSEAEYDESKFARQVANHLKTDHIEKIVTPEDALNVIPLLPTLYDEPFSDSSQIPTYLVSKIAREKVTVALSGDGGDELFGGYNRHTWGKAAWNLVEGMPGSLKSAFASGLNFVKPASWNQIFQKLDPILPQKFKWSNPGEKLQKLSDILRSDDPEGLYLRLVSHWHEPSKLVLHAQEPKTAFTNPAFRPEFSDFSLRMMYLDLITYLPDDILAKVDRASMGVSLEARVPFLDPKVVEFAWSLPLDLKIREGKTKYLLRKLLYQYVPKEMIERPKMGFSVPIDHWLRGPLKEWASTLLSPERLRREGYLNADLVEEKWTQHLKGERNFQHHLWDVLMFQAWFEKNHP